MHNDLKYVHEGVDWFAMSILFLQDNKTQLFKPQYNSVQRKLCVKIWQVIYIRMTYCSSHSMPRMRENIHICVLI